MEASKYNETYSQSIQHSKTHLFHFAVIEMVGAPLGCCQLVVKLCIDVVLWQQLDNIQGELPPFWSLQNEKDAFLIAESIESRFQCVLKPASAPKSEFSIFFYQTSCFSMLCIDRFLLLTTWQHLKGAVAGKTTTKWKRREVAFWVDALLNQSIHSGIWLGFRLHDKQQHSFRNKLKTLKNATKHESNKLAIDIVIGWADRRRNGMCFWPSAWFDRTSWSMTPSTSGWFGDSETLSVGLFGWQYRT